MEEYLKKKFIIELEKAVENLKSLQIVSCNCWFCGKEKELPVKTVRRKLIEIHEGISAGLFCGQSCFSAYKHLGRICPVHDCKNCAKRIQEDRSDRSIGQNNFCSHTCSAIYNNKGQVKKEATKEKIRSTLSFRYESYCELPKNFFSGNAEYKVKSKAVSADKSEVKHPRKPRNADAPYCKFEFVNCEQCQQLFVRKSKQYAKFCSIPCRTKHLSARQKERLSKAENRVNLGRHKPSYMERTFSEWLDNNAVPYETEVQFKNHASGKYYYADFVFKQFMLIIELDGNHHKGREELDRVRDEYLESYYGYKILRISHKEYTKQTKVDVVKSLLMLQ